jgi:hypothetical protein
MMMFAAAILAKRSLASIRAFFLSHLLSRWPPYPKRIRTALSQGSERRTSTREDSNMRPITTERRINGNRDLPGKAI